MNLRLRDPVFVLIILALGLFVAYQCQSARVANLERLGGNRLTQDRIAELQGQVKSSALRADSLEASFIRRRTSDSLALRALSVRNKAMSETVQKLRIPVQVTIDTMAALGKFIQAYDSLLTGKDEEIKQLELRHEGQIIDLTKALEERGNQILAQAAQTEIWRQSAVQAQGDVRKEVRRKTFWKITSAVLASGLVIISIRE